jgi:hypothetical protein
VGAGNQALPETPFIPPAPHCASRARSDSLPESWTKSTKDSQRVETSSAGGGIRTHEPLRDGISRRLPLKSHATTASQGVFDQAQQPPQSILDCASVKSISIRVTRPSAVNLQPPLTVPSHVCVGYRTDLFHPPTYFIPRSQVCQVKGELVVTSMVNVRISTKLKAEPPS